MQADKLKPNTELKHSICTFCTRNTLCFVIISVLSCCPSQVVENDIIFFLAMANQKIILTCHNDPCLNLQFSGFKQHTIPLENRSVTVI